MVRCNDPGFVYVLSNEHIPNALKIGKTTKDPMQRASQLNSTGVPSAFVVEFAIWTRDCSGLEARAHERLAAHRISPGREFFRCYLCDAVVAICQLHEMSFFTEICNDERLIFDSDVNKLTNMLDMEVMDIRHLLQFVSDEAWEEAGRKRRAQVEERRRMFALDEPWV